MKNQKLGKDKVLNLQQLELVSGGYAQEMAALGEWSTPSIACDNGTWSTQSTDCGGDKTVVIQQL